MCQLGCHGVISAPVGIADVRVFGAHISPGCVMKRNESYLFLWDLFESHAVILVVKGDVHQFVGLFDVVGGRIGLLTLSL